MHAERAEREHARRGIRQEILHRPRRRRSAQTDGHQIGKDFFVPPGVNSRHPRVAADLKDAALDGLLRLLPHSEIRLEVVANLVQQHAHPPGRFDPFVRHAHERKRVVLAEQAPQHHAAPERRRREAVFEIGDRLQQRTTDETRRRLPDDLKTVGGDGVARRQRRRERGAALDEDIEEQSVRPPCPIHLPFDERSPAQEIVVAAARPPQLPRQRGQLPAHVPIDLPRAGCSPRRNAPAMACTAHLRAGCRPTAD